MGKAAIFLAEGFEEIEALTVVDICRRCGIDIDVVSIAEEVQVVSSHSVTVTADKTFSQAEFDTYDMLILPGGMPGTKNLEAHEPLMKQIDAFYARGRYIAAICAASGGRFRDGGSGRNIRPRDYLQGYGHRHRFRAGCRRCAGHSRKGGRDREGHCI